MPSAFFPKTVETERKSPGVGGKPPVDHRSTGGGGGGSGGGDDEWKNAPHGPRELLNKVRTFVFCALASDMTFFLVLVFLFYARQTGTHFDPHMLRQVSDWRPVLMPPILFLDSAILIVSMLTMEMARYHIFEEMDVLEEWFGFGRPALRHTLPWLGGTLALGILFLGGQAIAWHQLTAEGYAFDRIATPVSYFFHLVTGLHAAHLALGLIAIMVCLILLHVLRRVDHRQIAVDATAWFWHAMGIAWLFLFAVLTIGH